MHLYYKFSVKHYWIVNTEAHILEEFDLTHERPQLVTALADNAMFRPRLFPNLEISLKALCYPEKENGKND